MKELSENELLTLIQSWENLALVARHISDHPAYMKVLMKLVLDDSDVRNWRAAWMVDKIHEKHPDLIIPYLPALTDFILITDNAGKKRHLLKLISLHELSEEKMGVLLDFCIEILTSSTEPIAVRAHAMQVLYEIAVKEPDLAPELIELIRHQMEYHSSAGITAKGKSILQKLMALSHPAALPQRKGRKSFA